MATPIPINERLQIAGQLVARTRIFYDIWWFYESSETRPRIIDTMNHFSEFFRFDAHAQLVSFVVHAAALFENRNDTVNLPAITAELKRLHLISAESTSEAESLLTGTQGLASKLVILRSNLFAHRSSSLSYADAFKKADITPNQLGHICELALRIVNCLLDARGLGQQVFHPLPRQDAEKLLNALGRSSAA